MVLDPTLARSARPRCAFLPAPVLPRLRASSARAGIRISPRCSHAAAAADVADSQMPGVYARRPGRWRRATAIAAAIAAGVFLPGGAPSALAGRPPGGVHEEASTEHGRPSAGRRHVAARAVRIRPVPAAAMPAAAVASGTDAGLVESLAVFRSKAAEIKDSLLHALTHDDENGHSSHQAAVNDALVLLLTTVVIVPLMRSLNTSPILGFLAAGIALGPNGLGLVRDVATSKALAELGVVFFLFEMGLELSTSKLKSLGADVFGLGTAQFLVTGTLIALATCLAKIPITTAIVIGAGLALSSSAFVLQLLAERGEVGTRHGRAGFGILIFQDLAVVPVLVLTPLLAGAGGVPAVMSAISIASAKAAVALLFIVFMGKNFLQPVFRFVARSKSPEAFIAVILLTVLGTSSLTQALGLSDTLGAFLAGVMLAETKYRHQVEADIQPFRGLLLGLFFITVGFSIDLKLALANIGTVASLVTGLVAVKAAVIAAAGVAFGMSVGTSLRTGLMLSQGGEFAFVIFGLAQGVGVLPPDLAQLLLLVVALSMGLTPMLSDLGANISAKLESKRGLIGMRMEDADTADARDFVMVAGYGRVGQSVCELLDAKLVRYMAFDMSPVRVIEARNKGLPVYFGDACRPEVLRSAGVGRARAVVMTLDDPKAALQAVQNIRREFPDLRVFCRARDSKQQRLLQAAGATAIVPELLEASLLLGGAVLLDYGTPIDEVNSLIEEARLETWNDLVLSDNNSASLRSQFRNSAPQKEAVALVAAEEEEAIDAKSEEAAKGKENKLIDVDALLGTENEKRADEKVTPSSDKPTPLAADEQDDSDPEDIYAPRSSSRSKDSEGDGEGEAEGAVKSSPIPPSTKPAAKSATKIKGGEGDVDIGMSPA